jgi:ribonuclease HII
MAKPSSLIEFDRSLGAVVCGADEAGRGCLAGPIVAAAVRIDYSRLNEPEIELLSGLDDSKRLTPDRREQLLPIVMRCARSVGVVARGPRWIDELGLHRTNLEAVATALNRVWRDNAVALSDGYQVNDSAGVSRPIVKGDATSAAIAAASVVAKVTRDRMMRAADARHPGYGFAQHFGYATEAHREAIVALGPSPIHRMSFASVAYEQLSLAG